MWTTDTPLMQTAPWPAQARTAFSKLGIQTLGDLIGVREVVLLKVPGFGRKTLNYVRVWLSTINSYPDHWTPLVHYEVGVGYAMESKRWEHRVLGILAPNRQYAESLALTQAKHTKGVVSAWILTKGKRSET